MKKYFAELIGTFFLVLTIGCTVIGHGAGSLAPLAIGSALMIFVFAGGHISGGHYNPAVTFGVWLRGKCPSRDVIPYISFQVIGSVLAALAVRFFKAGSTIAPIHPATAPALLAEFLFTFALVYVVLNVAATAGTAGNSFYGLAIGFTVMVGAFSVGSISGGAFNPAVAVGISVLGLSSWAHLWIYLVAELAGAAVAAGIYRAIAPSEKAGVPAPASVDRSSLKAA